MDRVIWSLVVNLPMLFIAKGGGEGLKGRGCIRVLGVLTGGWVVSEIIMVGPTLSG